MKLTVGNSECILKKWQKDTKFRIYVDLVTGFKKNQSIGYYDVNLGVFFPNKNSNDAHWINGLSAKEGDIRVFAGVGDIAVLSQNFTLGDTVFTFVRDDDKYQVMVGGSHLGTMYPSGAIYPKDHASKSYINGISNDDKDMLKGVLYNGTDR